MFEKTFVILCKLTNMLYLLDTKHHFTYLTNVSCFPFCKHTKDLALGMGTTKRKVIVDMTRKKTKAKSSKENNRLFARHNNTSSCQRTKDIIHIEVAG